MTPDGIPSPTKMTLICSELTESDDFGNTTISDQNILHQCGPQPQTGKLGDNALWNARFIIGKHSHLEKCYSDFFRENRLSSFPFFLSFSSSILTSSFHRYRDSLAISSLASGGHGPFGFCVNLTPTYEAFNLQTCTEEGCPSASPNFFILNRLSIRKIEEVLFFLIKLDITINWLNANPFSPSLHEKVARLCCI